MMDMQRFSTLLMSIIFLLCLSSCTPASSSPTPYLPPSPVPSLTPTIFYIPTLPPGTPIPTHTTTPTANPTSAFPCTHNLDFLEDLTIADDTIVAPGSSLDKQWLVQNTGDCTWDNSLRLRLIDGDLLGADPEQPLPPAPSAEKAVVSISFTAPSTTGTWYSVWQAFDSDGVAIGEAFMIRVVVQP